MLPQVHNEGRNTKNLSAVKQALKSDLMQGTQGGTSFQEVERGIQHICLIKAESLHGHPRQKWSILTYLMGSEDSSFH